jgi:hypothetical protein
VISFLNFDGSSIGELPAGFANTTTIPGFPGDYKVGTTGSISSPKFLYDASGNTGGSALWTGLLAADKVIQFDQIVDLLGGVMNPLIRMSANGQTGYGAFISWSTSKINFVVISAGGVISTLASPAIPSYSNGDKVTVKLEIQGTNLRFKSWQAGTTEPASWTAATTDSTYTTAGYGGFSNGGGSLDNLYFGPAETTFCGGFVAPVLSSGTTTQSEGINAPVNSNVLTLTNPIPTIATTFTLTGPSIGIVDQASMAFTVTPNGSFTGTITISPAGCGLATPIVLTFTKSASLQTFTMTPLLMGTVTLTAINSGSLQNAGPLSYFSTSACPYVAGSGQSIGLAAPDVIAAIATGNDVQTLTIGGFPADNEFTLTFNGQTTAPIASTTVYPSESNGSPFGLYTIPVTPGTQYTLATNLVNTAGNSTGTTVQIIDGNVMAASVVLNQLNGTPDYTFTDTTSADPGQLIYAKNLVTYTPTTSTLLVYFGQTAASHSVGNACCDVMILTDVATGAVSYFDDSNSTAFSYFFMFNGTHNNCYNGECYVTNNLTIGGVNITAEPSPIQAALEELSSIGPGGVLVTGSGPYTITFTGPKNGAVSRPLITGSDPAISIAHTTVGGNVSTITITPEGGSPGAAIPIANWVWGSGIGVNNGANIAPYAPYALGILPQSAPDNLFYPTGEGYSTSVATVNVPGYSVQASVSTTEGDYALWYMQGLPPATYQVAFNWTPSSAHPATATAVPIVILDNASGATLASVTINQSIAPGSGEGDFVQADAYGVSLSWRIAATFTTTGLSTGFNVRITNPGGSVAFDTVLVTRTSADLSVQIHPTDTVTFTAPAGFITTASGPSAAFSAVIPNFSGGTSFAEGGLGAFNPTGNTMEVGYNVDFDVYGLRVMTYSDQIRRLGDFTAPGVTLDVNGYPTLSPSQTMVGALVQQSQDEYGLGKGGYAAPSGLWTVQWNGPESVGIDISGFPAPGEEVMELQNLSGPVKQRVFNMYQPVGALAPTIRVVTTSASSPDENGNYTFSSNNYHVYPPDPSDPTGMTAWGILGTATPPLFHPNFIAQVQGAGMIRFLNWLSTNDNPVSEFSDWRQPGMLQIPTRRISAAITSITAATAPFLFDPSPGTGYAIIEITTAEPHDAFGGMLMNLSFTGTAEFSGGASFTAPTASPLLAMVGVVSSTVIQMQIAQVPAGQTMTNTLTNGLLTGSAGTPDTAQNMVALCNQVGAGAWINGPASGSNACFTAIGEYFAANLNPGLKFYAEYGNENWNYGFSTYYWCQALAWQLTGTSGDAQVGQVLRGQVYHNNVLDAFTAVGRAADVVRVIGSQAGNIGITADIITQCQSNSITFDMLATAPYFVACDTVGGEPTFQNVFDLMTPYGTPGQPNDGTGGQASDWYELMVAFNRQFTTQVADHKNMLVAAGMTNVLTGCYEGGTDIMVPCYGTSAYSSSSTVNAPYREHCIARHPRAYYWMLAMLQQCQNAGCAVWPLFYVSGGNDYGGSYPNYFFDEWAVYDGWNEKPGTGNSAIDTVNATKPEQLNLIVSEVGGACNYWNLMIPITKAIETSGSYIFRQIRATGLSTRGGNHN